MVGGIRCFFYTVFHCIPYGWLYGIYIYNIYILYIYNIYIYIYISDSYEVPENGWFHPNFLLLLSVRPC